MGKSKAPAPPDPAKTAGAQTAQNIGTAIAQSNLNNVNQVTPDGSLTYTQSGTYDYTDPNTGQVYKLPQYTATQALSAGQQGIYDTNQEAERNLSTLARDQSARLGTLLGAPVDLSNEAVEGRLMELGRARLDPALERRRETLRTNLSGQGIKEGSAAYDRAMARDMEGENDAYNQLLLSGRGQAVQETMAARNQPINEITALMSGSQVSMPQFVGTNPANIANVDRAGLEMSNYNARLANWQQSQAQKQSVLGGLFGLGSAAIMSDVRLKTDIRRVGTTDAGLPVFVYRYRGRPEFHMGVMAQDVAEVLPQAVVPVSGFLAVNYEEVR
jgi:hypothetical protein